MVSVHRANLGDRDRIDDDDAKEEEEEENDDKYPCTGNLGEKYQ